MRELLIIRERLKTLYSKFEIYITPLIKFLTAFITLLVIKTNIGYMSKISNIAIVLVIALMCSFLPYNLIIVLATIYTIGNIYALSLEVAGFTMGIILLLYLLYFRFSPKDTFAVLLTPVCFALNVPYLIPISVGLVGTPASMVSVSCGTLVYYLLNFIKVNAEVIKNKNIDGTFERFRFIVDGLLHNKGMLVMILAFAVTITIVYFIKRLSINYAWTIAIVTGALSNIVIVLVGDLVYSTNVSIAALFFGMILSVLLAVILQFFLFNVDYTRSESVQFEDDDYYYYVKAVPKNTIHPKEKKVHRINAQKIEDDDDIVPSDRVRSSMMRDRQTTVPKTTQGTMRTVTPSNQGTMKKASNTQSIIRSASTTQRPIMKSDDGVVIKKD